MRLPSDEPLVVAFGSNLGDRFEKLRFGVESLQRAGICIDAFSSVFETPPIGFSQQPAFLNMVAVFASDLPPSRVLSIFQSVENEAGRTREFDNAPRTLDLDLIFFGSKIVRERGLSVPHPRWKERSFVVGPLMEVAPWFRDPETGWQVREVAQLWPMEPAEIRIVEPSDSFRKTLLSVQRDG